MTVRPPRTDWIRSRASPAMPSRNRSLLWGRVRRSTTTATANRSTRAPAHSLWRCSQNTPPVISGIIVPKQVGQSGQARLDPVACTTLPRRRSARVQKRTNSSSERAIQSQRPSSSHS